MGINVGNVGFFESGTYIINSELSYLCKVHPFRHLAFQKLPHIGIGLDFQALLRFVSLVFGARSDLVLNENAFVWVTEGMPPDAGLKMATVEASRC